MRRKYCLTFYCEDEEIYDIEDCFSSDSLKDLYQMIAPIDFSLEELERKLTLYGEIEDVDGLWTLVKLT